MCRARTENVPQVLASSYPLDGADLFRFRRFEIEPALLSDHCPAAAMVKAEHL
jgi:hypothetical protein